MPTLFTLAEARALLPRVDRLLRDAIDAKGDYDEAEQAIHSFKERVMLLGGITVDRERALEEHRRREQAAERLKRSVEAINEVGCVIKDLDVGLVDFPALHRGEEVYLCWKMGEADIEFWHGMEEGFAGRKPVGSDFGKETR